MKTAARALEPWLRRMRAPAYRLLRRGRQWFDCPVCGYAGPFMDKGPRRHAKCPSCGSLERARLQFAVLDRLLADFAPGSRDALHVAPEEAFRPYLRDRFRRYVTGDLVRRDVDHRFDIQAMPFEDGSFDFVFASHVLEYPADDRLAIREIRRVLRPGGVAVLPVPLMGERTVDRTERHPVTRVMHEPGLDYFARFGAHFARVDLVRSDDVDARYQPFVRCPDGSVPMPLVQTRGVYIDVVPVCRV